MIPSIKLYELSNKNIKKNIYRTTFSKQIVIPEWKYNSKIKKFYMDSKNNMRFTNLENIENKQKIDERIESNETNSILQENMESSVDSISDIYSDNSEDLLWCTCKNVYMNEKYICKKCIKTNKLNVKNYNTFIPKLEFDIIINCDIMLDYYDVNKKQKLENTNILQRINNISLENVSISISYQKYEAHPINYETSFFLKTNNLHYTLNNELKDELKDEGYIFSPYVYLDKINNSYKLFNKNKETIDISTEFNFSLNLYDQEDFLLHDCLKIFLDGKINIDSDENNIELGLCEEIKLIEFNKI